MFCRKKIPVQSELVSGTMSQCHNVLNIYFCIVIFSTIPYLIDAFFLLNDIPFTSFLALPLFLGMSMNQLTCSI
jgi:hypothetical protein